MSSSAGESGRTTYAKTTRENLGSSLCCRAMVVTAVRTPDELASVTCRTLMPSVIAVLPSAGTPGSADPGVVRRFSGSSARNSGSTGTMCLT